MAELMTMPTTQAPLVSVKGVSKTFGGIRALDDVSLDLYSKDVVGLVGDNGAGKSTLIKILSGALEATLGEIELDGKVVTLAPPAEAQRLGVETVYQDLSLISSRSRTVLRTRCVPIPIDAAKGHGGRHSSRA
jgi:ABC-type sugar transport system ATPase subunit